MADLIEIIFAYLFFIESTKGTKLLKQLNRHNLEVTQWEINLDKFSGSGQFGVPKLPNRQIFKPPREFVVDHSYNNDKKRIGSECIFCEKLNLIGSFP